MGNRSLVVGALIALGIFIAYETLYTVKETEAAVLLEFGRLIRAEIPPGLHVKKPLINEVKRFDARVQTFDAQPQRYFTIEKKALIVDSYVLYRISDVETYYTATNGDEFQTARLLAQRVNTGLRDQFGERTMREVVSGERDQLMTELVEKLSDITRDELGVQIVDIRVKRIDLPEDVSHSVFERMKTERERLAREYRSKGREQAEVIQAKADREKTIIEADAYREAERIRGDGDAKAARIYAQAYNRDPEFYGFYRSLLAYRGSFTDRSDLLLLSPDSDFFRYFKNLEPADSR
ncbi:MAG: protease modulator HflC [Pseudomonadota bacterium]|nr:protease modulator HflC [Pseudomonadota bacterium]